MQQALENEHFKKIWEEVNWKIRHPEAKSLEEALFLETHNADCNVLHCGLNLIVFMQSRCLLRSSGWNLGSKSYHSFSQSFGRTINLEDILILLSQEAYSVSIPCFASNILVTILNGGVVTEYFIDWQLGKSIYEQTAKTWEQIANLIKIL
jgi:hypothetical protein